VREPDDHTRCLIPQDKDYLSALNVLIKKKIERWVGDEGSCEVLRVVPQAIRKRRIANGNVLATKGHFYLHGTPKGLRFILEQGLGANTAMGFGFVVNVDGSTEDGEI
jgi:CRISPR-associated endoribonuclease Cas6